MNIVENPRDLIGNTPLIRIRTLSEECGAEIVGKLECSNPMSSEKDRIALSMVEDAEQNGLLQRGNLVIEPTSGNTGISIAFIAASKGYRCILTMPETVSSERRKLLSAFGAELVLTPGSKGMKGALEQAEEIQKQNPGSVILNQFKNPANPQAHKDTTAEEIWRDCDGAFDIFISAVATGGTLSGCGELFKQRNPNIKIIAVEPKDSAVLSGGSPGHHQIYGIGAGFIPENLNTEIIDEIVAVKTDDAVLMTRALARDEGILTGISSGAALAAAKTVAKREENRGKRVVVVLPDCGERYLSTDLFVDLS